MKLLKLMLTTIALIAITLCFTSCKKDSAPKQTCRIITATLTPPGDPYNLTYNSDGKLSTSSNGTSATTFTYSGNTIVATNTNSGAFSSQETITVNTNGLATNVKTEYDIAGTSWSNVAYDYSGTELIKQTGTSSSGGTPDITSFTWSGGNLISITSGTSVTTLEYYTDKFGQTGDYLQLNNLLIGYEIFRTKNAIKSILSTGSVITDFNYTFDDTGKITALAIVSGSTTSTYNYQYQCN